MSEDRSGVEGVAARARRASPFVAVTAAAFLLSALPPGPRHPGAVVLAGVIAAALVAAEVLLPWRRLPVRAQGWPLLASFVPIALLRQGGGTASDSSMLVVLPLLGCALLGSRGHVVLSVLGTGAVFLVPPLTRGEAYPPGEWGRALLWMVIGVALVPFVHSVVQQDRREVVRAQRRAAEKDLLADVTRSLTHAEDARGAACAAASRLAGADVAFIAEPDGAGALVATAGVGADIAGVRVPLDGEVSATVTAYRTQREVFVSDVRGHPGVSARLVEPLGIVSAVWQPVLRGGQCVGVLVLLYRRRLPSLPPHLAGMLGSLAEDTAVAIARADLVDVLTTAASQDPLTRAANRRCWDERLAGEIARARRSGSALSVALVDLDHFKRYNDEHGHLAGDELLRDFATAVSARLRDVDTFARWGGEEFAIALPFTSLEEAAVVADGIRAVVPAGQTCTIGIAGWSPGTSGAQLLERADAALYAGRAAGRDTTVTSRA